MVVDPLALRVDDLVGGESIFKLDTLARDVAVHAAVAEGALSTTLVEEAARDLAKCCFVLVNERFLVSARRVEEGWDD